MKKFFITVTGLLLFFLLSWGVISFLRQKTPEETVLTEKTQTTQDNDVTPTNSFLRNITSIPIKNYTIDINDETALYIWNAVDDTIYHMDTHGGNMKKIKHLPLPDVAEVSWSNNNAILIKSQGIYYAYDFDTGDLRRMKNEIDFAVWGHTPGEIVYKYFDKKTNTRTLDITQLGASWRTLTTIPYRYINIQPVPHSTLIAYWPEPSAYTKSTLNTISIIGTQKPTEVYDGLYGASYLYAPNGKKILISATRTKGGKGMSLATTNERGGEYQNLSIPTFVQKAVWSKDNKTVYYALPNDFPKDSVMPDDYKKKTFMSRDTFWKLDTTTGKKKRLITLEDINEKIDATNLMLSPAEDTLFFINRINGLLYALSL